MRFLRRPFYLLILLTALVSLALHFRFLHLDIVGQHAWRQSETQANIHHFAQTDPNIFNPRTFFIYDDTEIHRREFPLLQWITGMLLRMTGENFMAERLFFLLIGIFSIAGLGKAAHHLFGRPEAAPVAAWMLCFSPLFYYYTINPLPDMLALCFACWGTAYFFQWQRTSDPKSLAWSVLLIAIAALCKLPFIVFIALYAGWLWNEWRGKSFTFRKFIFVSVIIVAALAVPFGWYYIAMSSWKNVPVTTGMLSNTLPVSQLLFILQGTLTSTLPELLLNYGAVIFFMAGLFFFFRKRRANKNTAPLVFLLMAILAYYLFELNAITLIHDYYLMPFLPVLFIAATYGFLRLSDSGGKTKIAALILLLALPVTAALRIDSRWSETDPGFNRDWLVYRDQLRKTIPAEAHIITGNDQSGHISHHYAQRYGWSFNQDKIDTTFLSGFVRKGAAYLVSDSRRLENDPAVIPFLGEKIKTFGSLRIIRLHQTSHQQEEHR